ncbi:MAG TPA: glutamate racemase [Gemmatimonadaceae bacterium]|nr:glutamate racemase [Gemmatimonadaceae bacterium]
MNDAAIGVFDSGIGGLTVVAAIMRTLPDERVVYVGDTARVPYGPKSPDTVLRYSRQIAAFLLEQRVKAIVIACNTATAHALEALQREVSVPVIGVVTPGARAAVRATRSGRVGVIGTTGTINSGAYHRAIASLAPEAVVTGVACPLFVPLVEEGWVSHPATRLIADSYLGAMREHGVDTLVLGCTHYPLLAPMIAEVVGSDVTLVDSAAETALALRDVLQEHDLCASGAVAGLAHRFVATDAPDAFRRVGQRFIGPALDEVETTIFA